jgi:hypothetical protein
MAPQDGRQLFARDEHCFGPDVRARAVWQFGYLGRDTPDELLHPIPRRLGHMAGWGEGVGCGEGAFDFSSRYSSHIFHHCFPVWPKLLAEDLHPIPRRLGPGFGRCRGSSLETLVHVGQKRDNPGAAEKEPLH